MNKLKIKTAVYEEASDDDESDDNTDDEDDYTEESASEEVPEPAPDLLETPEDAQLVSKEIACLLELAQGLPESSTGLREIRDENTPKGFVKFARGNEVFMMRKSTVLWTLTTATSKLSTDRLHRFIDTGDDDLESDENIRIGDFIRINWQDQVSICSVLHFKYKSAKHKFVKSFCPIKHKDGQNGGVGVNMLVDFYRVVSNILTKTDDPHCYVNIDSYIEHIKTKRDIFTQKYMIQT